MPSIRQAAALAAVVLGTGATAATGMTWDLPDLAVRVGPWEARSALDGQPFRTTGLIMASGAAMSGTVFSGLVAGSRSRRSRFCCGFGRNDRRTWNAGDATRFPAAKRCADGRQAVHWCRAIAGDEMHFEGTWMTRHWYWARQIAFVGEGARTSPRAGATGG